MPPGMTAIALAIPILVIYEEAYHIYHCNIITNPISNNFVVEKVNSNAPLLL